MFERQKAYLEENKDNKLVRAAKVFVGLALAYAGLYLFQHGISPALSDKSTLKATVNNLVKNTFSRDTPDS